jgi:hypothetical protein
MWVVETATHDEEMATVQGAPMHHGQASPIKEAFAFGTQASRETLPIPSAEGLLCDAGYITEQETCACLHTDNFGGRDGHRVGATLLL